MATATPSNRLTRTVRWLLTLIVGLALLLVVPPIAGANLGSPWWQVASLGVPAIAIYLLMPPESRGF